MTDARTAAFRTLCKIERDNSYSNLLLSDNPGAADMSKNDRLLYHRLVKTVLERKSQLIITCRCIFLSL